VRQRTAVRPTELPRDAPFVAAEHRLTACELDCGFVVVADLPVSIGHVNGGRQHVEQHAGLPLIFVQSCFRQLALANVVKAIDRADDISNSVLDRFDIDQCDNTGAVWPFQ
jgi:hypothetical protein